MPSSIPYDPSLTLGNIVPAETMATVESIAELQRPADVAEDSLNSMISLKRSIDMTIQEMIEMNVDPTDVLQESVTINKDVAESAKTYATAKIGAQKAIQKLKAKLHAVDSSVESPINYEKSSLKQLPLASDSMNMNTQYFAFDENAQSSASHAATVAGFVSSSIKASLWEGTVKGANDVQSSVQQQVNSQHANHSIAGTLVATITATHKNALVWAPYIMDPDKALRAWNTMNQSDMITPNDPAAAEKILKNANTDKDKHFNILSGVTFGSSFVAMVHVLNTTKTDSSQTMTSVAESLQETFEVGNYFEFAKGGFGCESSFSDGAKNLLSQQNISSHCSIVTMGIIPSVKSNTVKMAVKGFSDFSPDKAMEALAKLQGATATANDTVGSAAAKAREGQQMIELQNSKIQSVMSGTEEIDDNQNKIIDTNSLMTALDDYVERCVQGGENLGVPINYYLKPIYQSEIAIAWLSKYYPNKYTPWGRAAAKQAGGGEKEEGGSE